MYIFLQTKSELYVTHCHDSGIQNTPVSIGVKFAGTSLLFSEATPRHRLVSTSCTRAISSVGGVSPGMLFSAFGSVRRSRRSPGFPVHFHAFFLNRAAVGWAVSCSAFGLFIFFFFRSFVGEQTQTPTRPIVITG